MAPPAGAAVAAAAAGTSAAAAASTSINLFAAPRGRGVLPYEIRILNIVIHTLFFEMEGAASPLAPPPPLYTVRTLWLMMMREGEKEKDVTNAIREERVTHPHARTHARTARRTKEEKSKPITMG